MKVLILLKTKIRHCLRCFVDLILTHSIDIIEKHRDDYQKQVISQDNRLTLGNIQSCGNMISIAAEINIAHPDGLLIGHYSMLEKGVHLGCQGGIAIGENVFLEQGVKVYSSVNNPVAIGHNVRVGMDAVIMPGVRISDNNVVQPGTVVSSSIDDGFAPPSRQRTQQNRNEPGKLFFVVSTGRSGTTSLASILSQHPEVHCTHEGRRQLIWASTSYEHGIFERARVKSLLQDIYIRYGVFPDRVYGEVNQKFFNLIDIIHEILPEASFLWLTRDGRDTVASTYSRKWYSDVEMEELGNHSYVRRFWMENRIRGNLANDCSDAEWCNMSSFEKNCWYWEYVNRRIQHQFSENPDISFMRVPLESMGEHMKSIEQFLGLSSFHFENIVTNASISDPYARNKWSVAESEIFKKRCGAMMDLLYPEWMNHTTSVV